MLYKFSLHFMRNLFDVFFVSQQTRQFVEDLPVNSFLFANPASLQSDIFSRLSVCIYFHISNRHHFQKESVNSS